MKFYKVKTKYGTHNVSIEIDRYANGNGLAIQLVDESGEPYTCLTTNLNDGMAEEGNTLAYVDTNNNEFAEKFISNNHLGVFTGIYGYSGFCQYPLYRFDLAKLQEE